MKLQFLGLTIGYDHGETADVIQSARIEREAQAMIRKEKRAQETELRAQQIRDENKAREEAVAQRVRELKAEGDKAGTNTGAPRV